MRILTLLVLIFTGVLAAILYAPAMIFSRAAVAQDERAELSKTGENHKLLARIAGQWTFAGRHLSLDGATLVSFKGTLVRKPVWEGRYFIAETTGDKLVMPWSNGREIAAQDMTMEAYDNAKRRFVTALIDNHFDTGILIFEGNYDSATKTISYLSETEDLPGVKSNFWKTLRFVDTNHYVEEFFTEDAGRKVRATQINYSRVSK